jgi:hypothetical protein
MTDVNAWNGDNRSAALSPNGSTVLVERLGEARQELERVNRAVNETIPKAAVAHLRARLDGVYEARRAELEAERARVRQESLNTIAAARRAADLMVKRAAPVHSIDRVPVASRLPVEPPPTAPAEPWLPPVGAQLVVETPEVIDLRSTDQTDEILDDWATSGDAAAIMLPPLPIAGTSAASFAEPTVRLSAVDAQELATTFTTIVEAILDERLARLLPEPEPAKPSYWKNANHPDVILVAIIMLVCLVVVAAWMV